MKAEEIVFDKHIDKTVLMRSMTLNYGVTERVPSSSKQENTDAYFHEPSWHLPATHSITVCGLISPKVKFASVCSSLPCLWVHGMCLKEGHK